MTTRTYASPAAFKQALEQRLRAASGSGPDLARRRQLLVFDRFLARVVQALGDAAMLKGGLVLELRPRPNSRVKDLPDIALLASVGMLEADRLAAALEQTFTFRKTHALPTSLPVPNSAWETPYAAMAKTDQLAWPTLAEVTTATRAFLDPILAGERTARWEPASWCWRQ